MNRKKCIIIILILIIIFFSGCFLIKNNENVLKSPNSINENNLSKNTSFNNVTTSSNTGNNSVNNSSNVNDNSNHKDSYSMNQYNKKSKAKSNEITADDILKRVKKGVWWDDGHGGETQDVKLGKPYKYKDLWLVAAFDKKTNKFLGSIWVASEGGYFKGPDSYSDYKDIISGKTIKKSIANKEHVGEYNSNPILEEMPDYSKHHVLASSMSNEDYILISNQFVENIDNNDLVDLNLQLPIIDFNMKSNSSTDFI